MMTVFRFLVFKESEQREWLNLSLFALGKFISVFGSAIYTFSLSLYVLQLTGSGLDFAATLVLGTIPVIIISPFAGVLADRIDNKRLVVIADLVNGVLLAVFYIFTLSYGLQLMMIYVSTFLMAIFSAIFNVSIETAKRNIVTDKMLIKINSISKIIESSSSVLGPMIGGLIFAVIDIKLLILVNGLSFIFSAIMELLINFNFNPAKQPTLRDEFNLINDIRQAINFISDTNTLIVILSVFVSVNFFIGLSITVPIPFLINQVLHLETNYYGIIKAGFPVGMIIGALLVRRIRINHSYLEIMKIMIFMLSCCMMLTGLPLLLEVEIPAVIYTIYYLIIMLITGSAKALIDVPVILELQTLVPPEYLGRVLSIGISGAKIILPLALIVSGGLINVLPAASLPIAGGTLLLIVNLLIIKWGKFESSYDVNGRDETGLFG